MNLGGYTQSTSSPQNSIAVDPVQYHCSGSEASLQNCNRERAARCTTSKVVTLVCVCRNESGNQAATHACKLKLFNMTDSFLSL